METDLEGWRCACRVDDLLPDAGVCALLAGRQIALFRFDERVFATDNRDPASGVNVLARGLLGDIKGEAVVASPLYKHHYSLLSGRCIEDARKSINVYPVRVREADVWVNTAIVGIELFAARECPVSLQSAQAGVESLVLRDPRRGVYKRLFVSEARLRGALLYGDAGDAQFYAELMRSGQDIGPLRHQLMFGRPTMDAHD